MDCELSIVIPAFNEEQRIGESLKKIYNYFREKNLNFEIIVVNDGSYDGTEKVVLEFYKTVQGELKILSNERNFGKGYSVRCGILNSKAKKILFTDSDLSTPIEEFEKLNYWLEQNYDIAIGSRALKDSEVLVPQPFYREYAGKIFNLPVQMFFLPGIKDTQCGFKLFKSPIAKRIFSIQRIWGFSFDVETLYLAKKFGYKIKEVPVRWINSKDSKVNILKAPMQMIFELIKIRWYMKNYKT